MEKPITLSDVRLARGGPGGWRVVCTLTHHDNGQEFSKPRILRECDSRLDAQRVMDENEPHDFAREFDNVVMPFGYW